MTIFRKLKKFIERTLDDNNILVYQMGKVGSTSIERSLSNATHFHTLYARYACGFYADARYFPTLSKRLKTHLFMWVRRFLIKRRKQVKMITLVRDPYKRDVSHFFQDLQFWLTYHSLKSNEHREEKANFIEECFESSYNVNYAKNWFKEEIERFSGIDINTCEFDKDRGVGRLKRGKYELLILRMDKLKNLENEIAAFNGTDLKLVTTNTGENKWYGELYERFKEAYTPPDVLLSNIYGADWVSKFYHKEEVENMKADAQKIKFLTD